MSQVSTESRSIRDKLVAAARACVGTPWRHQGRVPGQHLDCVGLVWYTGVSAGLLPRERDFTTYGRMPQPERMGEILANFFTIHRPTPANLKPGSILWLKILGDPMHLAIYTGETIIHAVSSGPAQVVEHGFRGPWPKRIHAILEWQGLTDV